MTTIEISFTAENLSRLWIGGVGLISLFFERTNMTTIIATLVPEHQRLSITPQLFKQHFPFKIEPCIYNFARHLCDDYRGAYWHFYTLSNGGFYMASDLTESFSFSSENGHAGQVSADAFGIICCLYAYSHLSFSDNPELSKLCSDHYHALREFALIHGEAMVISRATD